MKRKKISRRTFLKAAIGTAGLGLGGHLLARKKYGSSYPKRVPLIKRVYADKRASFDFYFGRHGSAGDIEGVKATIEKARKQGQPYNLLIHEYADLPAEERKSSEQAFNKIRQGLVSKGEKGLKYRQAFEKLKKANKENQLGWAVNLLEIAAKEGLYFKFGEQYTPKKIEEMERPLEKEAKHLEKFADTKNQNERKKAVKALAEYLYYRDHSIARTVKQVRAEVSKLPVFKNKKIRVIMVFGRAHINAERNLDRIARAKVKIVGTTETSQYDEEAIALSKKGLKAIKSY